MTWFDLINNIICIGFALLAFPVGLLLICLLSDRDQYVERDWRVA